MCRDVAVVFPTGAKFFPDPNFQTNNTGWKTSTPYRMGEKKEFFNIY